MQGAWRHIHNNRGDNIEDTLPVMFRGKDVNKIWTKEETGYLVELVKRIGRTAATREHSKAYSRSKKMVRQRVSYLEESGAFVGLFIPKTNHRTPRKDNNELEVARDKLLEAGLHAFIVPGTGGLMTVSVDEKGRTVHHHRSNFK